MRKLAISALLTFISGFVDAAGFFGLQGLFAAHVTGNFVTMGESLVHGTHGIIGKLLVLPEFVVIVILTRFAGLILQKRKLPVLRPLLCLELLFLGAFWVLAVMYEPFPDGDSDAALAASFAAVAAMAILNAIQRVHLTDLPPITIMTGNTTQAALDAVELVRGLPPDKKALVRSRFLRTINSIVFFALGCASAIVLHFHFGFGFKDLGLPVLLCLVCVIIGKE